MHLPKTCAAYYHAQDKGRAIKGLVVFYLMWLGFMKGMGLKTCAGMIPCCVQDGYRNFTIVKFLNIPID